MFWRTGAILALVAALLLAALPAYATPPGGDDPATAVELTGTKVGDQFHYDTKSGSLKAGDDAFFKICDRGTNNPIGVTLNYWPWTPPTGPSVTVQDPQVKFLVWTPALVDGQWKLKEVGSSTPSSQPSGVKYWRGGTNVARTYYFQLQNYGAFDINYAIAFTGPLYPPPGLEIKPATPATKSPDIVDIAASAGSFKTLVAAVQAAGLVETLKGPGPFTVFAPTDEAFAKLPAGTVENLLKPENRGMLQNILTYHVVPGRVAAADVVKLSQAKAVNGQMLSIAIEGGNVKVDGATVVKTDIMASNGVIHVIDKVLLPAAPKADIVDTVVGAGSFKTLVAAAQAAGLVETLKGPGPFTILAPTDEAFAKLPPGTVETLLKPENIDMLKAVLTYHVVPGRVYSETVVGLKEAPTVNGQKINISIIGGKVMLNGAATVIKTDIDCANGVIHVIDQVILPK